MTHKICVIDTETLDIRESSIVLSIGLIIADLEDQTLNFQKLIDTGLHLKLNAKEQREKYGRTINRDTMAWWQKQGKEAQKILRASPDDINLDLVPMYISNYTQGFQTALYDIDIYQRGYYRGFDLSKLESIYQDSLKLKTPLNRYRCFDIPSIFSHMGHREDTHIGIMSDTQPGFVAHNALHDACVEVLRMQKVFKGMGLL